MPIKKVVEKRTLSYYDDVSYTLSDLRRINLFGEVSSSLFSHIENSLSYMQAKSPKKPVEIVMNTPGGSVIDGFAIYDSIRHYGKKMPINITVSGACMSMGVVILQAATFRRATENAQFLLHEVSYGTRSNLSTQQDEHEQAMKLQDRLDQVIVQRSGIPLAELKQLIKRRDYALTAQEALKHNLIDDIV